MTLCDKCPHKLGAGVPPRLERRPYVNCEIEGNVLAKGIICMVLVNEESEKWNERNDRKNRISANG